MRTNASIKLKARGLSRRSGGDSARFESLESRMLLSGTWTPLLHPAPSGIGTMMLLPDGTVLSTDGGDAWMKLTPTITGSYINGTWSRLAHAHDTRLYNASQVLPDGRVFVAGGEYGTGKSTGEMYSPLTNTWTQLPAQSFGAILDAASMLLPNGKVLIGPVVPSVSGFTLLFDPATNTWAQGPKNVRGGSTDEQSWVKLADDSILTIDGNTTSERYIPSQNKWINDAAVPVPLFDGLGEIGAALRLDDGRAFFIGATSHTALYTPSGSTAPGSWVAGPDIPSGLGQDDAPAAMLPDGKVLLVAGPTGTYNGPTTFFIYDPVSNSFSTVPGAPSVGSAPYVSRMLDLPDGTVLYSSGASGAYVYNPLATPLPDAVPTITSLAPNPDGTVLLTGLGLNGLSAGAAYGDDAQMDTNYPIVRLTSGTSVYYARTHDWSSTSVATGSAPETVTFTLPLGIPAGTYAVSAIANGVASAPTTLTISMTDGNIAPTVATAAAATPSPVTGTTTNLSVLGDDDSGEANLIYTWRTTGSPSTASLPSFSINGTNAAKNTTATFYQTGTYTFNVVITDAGGLSISTNLTVLVSATRSSIVVTPATASITAGGTQQFTATALDQFGNNMPSQPVFTWSITAGAGTINSAGRYTAPGTGTLATVRATDGTLQATAQAGVVSSPWTSADIGGPGITGLSYDTGGTFTLQGSGGDIWGTSDEFRFVYRTMTGNGAITARVATQQNTDGWAKSGVMIRNSLSASDQMAFMCVTPGNGTNFQYRTTSGGQAAAAAGTGGLTAPYWVRIVRSGNTLTGYRSANGTTWTQSGSVVIAMGATVDVGLEVCSHNNAALNTSTFTNVSLSQATVATAASATPNPVTATSTSLAVLGADPAGESTLNYTWLNTSAPPGGAVTYSGTTNGTNAAKNITANFNKAGQYQFTVTISDGVTSTTSSVTVNVNQTLTAILVSPTSASVQAGQTQQYSALGNDQFGNPMAVQPGWTWAVTGSGNSISAGGLLTAGTTTGNFTVSAKSGAVTGSTGVTVTAAASIVARQLFYNNSFWTDPANGFTNDDAAIDTSKTALTDGGTATFANYSGSFKGLNGIMIDVSALPAGTLAAGDFTFKVGNDSTPSGWVTAPDPVVSVRRGAGNGGSDRIELVWGDNVIQNQWLQVTVKPDAATGLLAADVSYFGNAIGDTGNNALNASVNSGDIIAVRDHPTSSGNPALVTNPYDFNHDASVNSTDMIIARDHPSSALTELQLIAPTAPAPAAPAAPSIASAVTAPAMSTSGTTPSATRSTTATPFSVFPIAMAAQTRASAADNWLSNWHKKMTY